MKRTLFLSALFLLLVFSLGMSRVPKKNMSQETRVLVLQVMLEESLNDIEYVYASRNSNDFLSLLDNDFDDKSRFESVLQTYFSSIEKPFIHFVIDMVIADKNGITASVHWQRRGITGSGVLIKAQGKSRLIFKRYPEGLKLKRILQENPFF